MKKLILSFAVLFSFQTVYANNSIFNEDVCKDTFQVIKGQKYDVYASSEGEKTLLYNELVVTDYTDETVSLSGVAGGDTPFEGTYPISESEEGLCEINIGEISFFVIFEKYLGVVAGKSNYGFDLLFEPVQ